MNYLDSETEKINIQKGEAEEELKKVQPALKAANEAVRQLSPEDIRELKSVKVPNTNTEITLKCVLAYFGHSELTWANA